MRLDVLAAVALLAIAGCSKGSSSPAALGSATDPGTHSPLAPSPVRPGPAVTPPASGPEGALTGKLALLHALTYPTRLAEGPTGRVYVSDARRGSLFVFNAELTPIGELKGISTPLGVAAAPDGTVYVGSRAGRTVLVFDATGGAQRTVGAGALEMPNDLALDRAGNLYVADSTAHRVQVFSPDGTLRRTIGAAGSGVGQLLFPAAVTVAYPPAHPDGELYVADQRNGRVAIFDLQGTWARALGGPMGTFGSAWQGRFSRIQALGVDGLGRVHAVDSYQNVVQVLDGDTGAFVSSYGSYGSGDGNVLLPLGIAILHDGRVVVADSENHRLEALRTLAPGEGG
jgi:DNA-binding beta-propeller fold protein YncE